MKINNLDLLNHQSVEPKRSAFNIQLENNTNTKSNNTINTINSYCYLPPIDKNIKKLAFQKPNSILNKFISKHAKDIISYTENNLNNVILLQNKFNEENKKDISSKSQKNTNIKSEEKKINSKIFKIRPNNKLNKISLGVLITNVGKNQKQNNIYNKNEYIEKKPLDISEDNEININDLYEKDKEETISRKKTIIGSIKKSSKISKENAIKLSSCFRRLCTYQPDIKLNWKFKFGLKLNLDSPGKYKMVNKDINNQSQMIDNHYRLLFNDINYYINTILKNSNYYPSFESLSLLQKINYNKCLEETIGIIVLLPKLLLNDFYELIKNSYGNIPKMQKFEDKYVFDEVKNLKDNNKLFFQVIDYFQQCYQMFQTVVKTFDKILFKPSNFTKIISCLEKARYNISYLNNSSENAFESYHKDLEIINRLKGQKNKSIKNLADKLRENYSFRRNKEKQKKIRINNSLTDRGDHNIENNNILKSSPYKHIKIKSIINSKMMTEIMRHCREDSKLKISTERINSEIDGDNREDTDEKKTIPPVIKMNLL